MALNFDNLPASNPSGGNSGTVLDKGIYPAVAKKGEMRKSTAGQEYLVVQLAITSDKGQTTVFDNFFNIDKPLPMFKLAQFLRAIGTVPTGNFELKDLVKIINNRPLSVALKIEKSEGYPDKNVVDAFDNTIYYAPTGTAPAAPAPSADDSELPFDVSDEGGAGEY